MLESYHARYSTPFAVLGVRTLAERVTDIEYLPPGVATLAPLNKLAEKVCSQVARYLEDPEYRFRLPFDYDGTPFQCNVWRLVSAIPSGRTATYKDIARAMHTAPRPIGGACGANRIPIVIPCHRVVSATGIGGFMRGEGEQALAIKRWLLRHEGVVTDRH
jgi:methylated-DNA-[protein]-cysteine S-methyltransferase